MGRIGGETWKNGWEHNGTTSIPKAGSQLSLCLCIPSSKDDSCGPMNICPAAENFKCIGSIEPLDSDGMRQLGHAWPQAQNVDILMEVESS